MLYSVQGYPFDIFSLQNTECSVAVAQQAQTRQYPTVLDMLEKKSLDPVIGNCLIDQVKPSLMFYC